MVWLFVMGHSNVCRVVGQGCEVLTIFQCPIGRVAQFRQIIFQRIGLDGDVVNLAKRYLAQLHVGPSSHHTPVLVFSRHGLHHRRDLNPRFCKAIDVGNLLFLAGLLFAALSATRIAVLLGGLDAGVLFMVTPIR